VAGLHIDIIAVGKLKERFWREACAEYLKRLGRYAKVAVSEVPDKSSRTEGSEKAVLRAEAALLQPRLGDSFVVMLDERGRRFSSEQIAALMADWQNEGVAAVSFVIGGSHGIDAALKQQADLLLSLGAITLPHNLARVVLLEQLYRGFRIINGEPYHK
jgi:23S rRNA (pseudouridine1915-N3)-methyltransferase